MWHALQERRAVFFGRVLVLSVLDYEHHIGKVRKHVEEGGDEAEIALWSDERLRDDYDGAAGQEGRDRIGR